MQLNLTHASSIGSVTLSSLLAGVASADTLRVPDEHSTIQGALDAAVDGDTVAVDAGTFHESNLDPGGKQITITGALAADGSPATMVDALGLGGVWVFINSETSSTRLENFIITGGLATNGGGILCTGSPVIHNCVVTDNTAVDGGGIYCNDNSSPTISDCLIHDNAATGGSAGTGNGGGLYLDEFCTAAVADCTISENAASEDGGGVYCAPVCRATIDDCLIKQNSALDDGGGIWCGDTSSPVISDCHVASNSASDDGGGIQCDPFSTPIIQRTAVISNIATGDGGGISCFQAFPEPFPPALPGHLTDCLVSNNTASGIGGGIHLDESAPPINTCTVEENQAADGGGIACFKNSDSTITGTIVRDNSATSASGNGGGVFCNDSNGVTLDGCAVSGNSAALDGGGIWADAGVTVDACTISRNSAVDGGGLHLETGTPQITDSAVLENTASNDGGGLHYGANAFGTIDNCRIKENSAGDDGGAIAVDPDSNPTLQDSDVCGNQGKSSQITGPVTDGGGNVIEALCAADCLDVTGDGVVDKDDLLSLINVFNTADVEHDFNGDGVIGVFDLILLLKDWGACGS